MATDKMRTTALRQAQAKLIQENSRVKVKPKSGRVLVTPAIAESWLQKNTSNVPLSEPLVKRYSDDMLANNWHDTRDPIRFSVSGDLMNGQHRLWAILLSGVSLELNVETDIPEKARAYMDVGKRRTVGMALAMKKYPNYNTLASTVIILRGYYDYPMPYNGVLNRSSMTRYSHGQIIEWLEDHPEISECLRESGRWKTARILVQSPSVLAAAYCITKQVSSEMAAQQFFDALSHGHGLEYGDPILALRNRFLTLGRGRRETLRLLALALILEAWNAYRSGRKIYRLRTPTFVPIAQ